MPAGDFRLGDMAALPFVDESFDAVVGFNAFQFADDPVAAVAEGRRVLRADGLLAATTFAQPQVITARRALPAFVSKPMPADAAAVIRGVQTRAARIVAPRWVGPALRTRGLLDPLADRMEELL